VKLRILALAALLALPFSACSKSPADLEFDAKVRNYLLEHPEVIQEAMVKLEEKNREKAKADFTAAIKRHRNRIERDSRDFVANPNGTVTVTEFYDYNCGYCKAISPDVLKLIRDNRDVRFVFKEFHIFDQPSSLRGARAALLARRSGKYMDVHAAMMAEKPLQPEQVDAILRRFGVDPSPLDNPAAMAEIDRQLLDVQKLAADLKIEGTPAFVVGDVMVPYANLDEVRAAIAQARARR